MRNARRLLVFAVLPVVATAAIAATALAAPPDRTTVCHQTGSGRTIDLSLPEPAVRAHLAHGDTALGVYGYCP